MQVRVGGDDTRVVTCVVRVGDERAQVRGRRGARGGIAVAEQPRTMKTASILAALVAVTTTTIARADNPKWGTPEQSGVCTKDCDYYSGWEDKASPECKAELDRRIKACLDDPEQKKHYDAWVKSYKDAKSDAKLPTYPESCASDGKSDMESAMSNYKNICQKKQEDDDAKAKLESTEVPKATMHDAKIEAAIRKAFDSDDHGEDKVLKVVLEGWADEYETDAFGQITGRDMNATVVNKKPDGKCSLHDELYMQRGHGKSFSGPFESRGAGSASDTEIICSKVEGKAAAAPAKAPAKKTGK